MNYYEHHLGDWAKDVRGLSMAEEGAYRRLLDAYYSSEEPLPCELQDCYDLAGTRNADDEKAVDKVLKRFFVLVPGDGHHQKRADAEIARYQAKQANALRAAQARWKDKPPHSDGSAGALPSHTERTANAMPTHTERIPPTMRTHSGRNADAMHSQYPVTSLNTNTSDTSCPHPAADESAAGRPAEPEPKSAAETLPGIEPEPPPSLPDCPHTELIALYAKHLPDLAQPRVWENGRRETLRARWRACAKPSAFGPGYRTRAEGLAFWERYFAHVALNTRLAQGFPRRDGPGVWQPDLPWLVKADNFAKVVEGAYS